MNQEFKEEEEEEEVFLTEVDPHSLLNLELLLLKRTKLILLEDFKET